MTSAYECSKHAQISLGLSITLQRINVDVIANQPTKNYIVFFSLVKSFGHWYT